MTNKLQSSFPNCALSLNAVLQHTTRLSLAKVILIYPIITNKTLLSYLSRKNSSVLSMDKLLIELPSCFSNFNERYYDSIKVSINAIQYMYQMKHIDIEDGDIVLIKNIDYRKEMGSNLDKIYRASLNISNILNDTPDKLYLNLRIAL